MNNRKEMFLMLLLSAFIFSESIMAQSSGNLSVLEKGSLTIFGEHNFDNGSGFVAPGMIKTSRDGEKGYINFGKGGDWIGASANQFVDGYICLYHDDAFLFPIGDNNKYRPVAISGAKRTTAAYYNHSAYTKIEEDILANRIQATSQNISASIDRISNQEVWDIDGPNRTHISLSWGIESNVESITNGNLENLTLIGWKNGQWEIIPSVVEASIPSLFREKGAMLSRTSTLERGVISTQDAIVPNDYHYITLGAKVNQLQDANSRARILHLYPNPVVEELFVNLEKVEGDVSSIRVFNIYGVELAERKLNKDSEKLQRFDADLFENGIYKMYIEVGNQSYTEKFIVSRLY